MSEEPWYADGLRFACTRCGNCCTGPSGLVRVSTDEARAIAGRLGLREESFLRAYTRPLRDGTRTLLERPDDSCILWDRERGCTVYEERPRQCRTFPFWGSIVRTRESWARCAESCPGMGAGPRVDAATIRACSERDGTSGRPDASPFDAPT